MVLSAGEVKEPKSAAYWAGQVFQQQKKCGEPLDDKGYGFEKDHGKQAICRDYVYQCIAQGRFGYDEFTLVPASGATQSFGSYEDCISPDIIRYMVEQGKAGSTNFKPQVKPVEVKVEKPKDMTVRLADEKAYKILGLDSKKANVYYIDGDEDLVLVDMIAMKGHKGFAPEKYKEDGDMVVRLSQVKEKGKDFPRKKLALTPDKDQGLDAFMKRWAISSLEGTDPTKLVEYVKFAKDNLAKLMALFKAKNYSEVVSLYSNLLEKAQSIYMPVDASGAYLFAQEMKAGTDYDLRPEMVDTSWNGAVPGLAIAQLKEYGYLLPLVVAMHQSKSGDVHEMEKSLVKVVALNPKMDLKKVDTIRIGGYRTAIRKLIADAEGIRGTGKATVSILTSIISQLEKYLSVKATVVAGAPLFGEEDVIYEVHKTRDIRKKISQIKADLCVAKAKEILTAARAKKLTGKALEAEFVKIRALPGKVGVGAEQMDSVNVKLEQEIKAYMTGSFKSEVVRQIGYARKELAKKPVGDQTYLSIYMNDEWIQYIEQALSNASSAASSGMMLEDVVAEVGNDSVLEEIKKIGGIAHKRRVDAFIKAVNPHLTSSETSQFKDWFDKSLDYIRKAHAVLSAAKMINETLKGELLGQIEKKHMEIYAARIKQLFRFADKWIAQETIRGKAVVQQQVGELMKKARAVYAQAKGSGLEDFDKANELMNGIEQRENVTFSANLDEIKAGIDAAVTALETKAGKDMLQDSKGLLSYPTIKDNIELSKVNKDIDRLLAEAKKAGMLEKYATVAKAMRERAYKAYYTHHIRTVVKMIAMPDPPSALTLKDDWLTGMTGVLFHLKMAGVYADAKYGDKAIFDKSSVDAMKLEITMKKISAYFKDGERFRSAAKTHAQGIRSLQAIGAFEKAEKFFAMALDQYGAGLVLGIELDDAIREAGEAKFTDFVRTVTGERQGFVYQTLQKIKDHIESAVLHKKEGWQDVIRQKLTKMEQILNTPYDGDPAVRLLTVDGGGYKLNSDLFQQVKAYVEAALKPAVKAEPAKKEDPAKKDEPGKAGQPKKEEEAPPKK